MKLPFLCHRSKQRQHDNRKTPTSTRSGTPSATRGPPEPPIQPTPPKPLIPQHQDPQLSSHLCQLPIDIMHLIYRSLKCADKAALALTCHGFYANRNLSAIRYVNAKQPRRIKFLSRLDDNPLFLPCSACVSTHPLRGYEAEDTPTSVRPSGYKGSCEKRTGEVRVCVHYRLNYRMFLLVLRKERLGEGFGLDVSALKHNCTTYPWGGHDLWMTTDVKARVLEGRLLMRLSYKLLVDLRKSQDWDWEEQVKTLLKRPEPPPQRFQSWKAVLKGGVPSKTRKGVTCHSTVDVGCIHSHTPLPILAVSMIKEWAGQKKEPPDKDGGSKDPEATNSPIYQCKFCSTDFSVHVSSIDEPSQCRLQIVAYKELGASLPHTSTLWANATHPFGYLLDRSQKIPYGRGSIRARFTPLEEKSDLNLQWDDYETRFGASYRWLQEWKEA